VYNKLQKEEIFIVVSYNVERQEYGTGTPLRMRLVSVFPFVFSKKITTEVSNEHSRHFFRSIGCGRE
jgi:glutamate formiminotransferase